MDKPIKSYSLSGLNQLMKQLGQPAFRAQQLAQWLYVHHTRDYSEMTNLPASLRTLMASRFPLYTPSVIDRHDSADGTRKYLFEYHDGARVETVAIPSRNNDRLTVCFSTQVGCPMECSFCATGQEGLTRNLSVGEIVDQVLLVQNDLEKRVSNVVGMGQGEPFLNYDNVMAALKILNNPKGIAIGARHISISTCGIIPGIERFSREPEQFTLAVSLHAARQQIRDLLMPRVSSYSLNDLKKSLHVYTERTNRRVTLEYVMINEINDAEEDLSALCSFCSGLLCHVNLIPLNSVQGSSLQPSPKKTLLSWLSDIERSGTETTIRDSRGSDIAGACGQLKSVYND